MTTQQDRRDALAAELAARIAARPVVLPKYDARLPFPNDAPQEAVQREVMILRRSIAALTSLADDLEALSGGPPPPAWTPGKKITYAPNASAGPGERRIRRTKKETE